MAAVGRYLLAPAVLACAAGLTGVAGAQPHGALYGTRRPVPEFKIDLDRQPEERYTEVVQHFNASIQDFFSEYLSGVLKAPLRALLKALAAKRGPEVEEFQREIRGVARLVNIEESLIQSVQMLYELQTLMINVENMTRPHINWPHFGVKTDVPVDGVVLPLIGGPACTGILAMNRADGMVYHARNLDFGPKKFMQSLVYDGIFVRGSKEVFRAQMLAVYMSVPTGMKMGPNGFSIEANTRFPAESWGNTKMLEHLLWDRRPLNGWVTRKVLERASTYEAAVHELSTQKLVTSQYSLIGGVKKGTILARSADGVEYRMVLGQPNYACRDDYIIVTNFDFWWHDIKEGFDWTAHGGRKLPRRIAAQKLLNSSAALTPEVLFSTIDDYNVRSTDTIFQAVMSVEAGLWNVSLPALEGAENAQYVLLV